MRHLVLIVATVAAILVDGFFALVNFYPMAPERDRGPARYVLAPMNERQAAWFQTNMLNEYNDEHDTNFQVRAVSNEQLAGSMRAADVALAILPANEAEKAATDHRVVAFEGVITKEVLAADFADVRPDVLESARFQSKQFFLPRAIALDVAVYRISRVRDALLHWQLVRPEIEAALRAVNGTGLPRDYELDHQPADWDAYDLFVLGFYWSHRSYSGQGARARIAHRVGLSTEAQSEIAAGMYRAGMTDANLATRGSVPALDWFQWEALYRENGLYWDTMFTPAGVDDESILDGVTRGELYLTSVDQMQAFTLHGGSYRGARALVPDGDDLGFAPMPRFASLEINAHGVPARTAEPFSFREELMWALPAQNHSPATVYDLVKWVLEREDHARECEALGILPMRTDVIRERETLFREPWMQDVLEAGLDQWARAQLPPPTLQSALGVDYAVAWNRVVAQRGAPAAARDAIAGVLNTPVDRAAAQTESDRAVRSLADANAAVDDEAAEAAFAMPPLREPMVLEGLARDAGVDPDAEVATEVSR